VKDVSSIAAQSDDIFCLLEFAQTNTALVGLGLPLVLTLFCLALIRDLLAILHGYHAVHVRRLTFQRKLRML
jgi:hypothetical protein